MNKLLVARGSSPAPSLILPRIGSHTPVIGITPDAKHNKALVGPEKQRKKYK